LRIRVIPDIGVELEFWASRRMAARTSALQESSSRDRGDIRQPLAVAIAQKQPQAAVEVASLCCCKFAAA
jgi:hypothetical protein